MGSLRTKKNPEDAPTSCIGQSRDAIHTNATVSPAN